MSAGSYYEPVDTHRYKPTGHAGGAWDPDEQHFSPLGGLVVHAVERHLADRPGTGLIMSRISFDILGRLALDECEIRVETIRPGRTIELLEAVALIAGRPAVRARIWLLASGDTTAVAGGRHRPPPGSRHPRVLATGLRVARRLHPVPGRPSGLTPAAGAGRRLDLHRPGPRGR